jgi:signal transduction histidine kinase
MLTLSHKVILSCWLGVMSSFSLAAQELPGPDNTPLTNVSQVRCLSVAEAARGLPVKLRGVVITDAAPADRALILADATAGLYLVTDTNKTLLFHRGDFLEVSGITDPGEFAPIVKVTVAHRLGMADIPDPRPVSYQQLVAGALDGQWVEISGVVRRYLSPATNSDVWRMLLAAGDGLVWVRGSTPHDPQIQEDAVIQVRAVCFCQFNRKRQILRPLLEVPPGLPIRVVKPAPANPFDAPVRLSGSLLQFAPDIPAGHRIHVRGVVTHSQPGSQVWIRDASAGLRIQTWQNGSLQAGDQIDVLGFPTYGSDSPTLEDAIFRKSGAAKPPAPLFLTNAAAAFDHDEELVALDARLVGIQPMLKGLSFTFDLGGTNFKGVLEISGDRINEFGWRTGSRVRVAGICSMIHDDVRPMAGVWKPQGFQVLLRSPTDLTILAEPPWWTPEHIFGVVVVASALLLVATGALLWHARRRLKEQAQRRTMVEAEFAAMLAERNRVAREIHDTLAQGLAATSVQLRLAKKTAHDAELLGHHLDAAQQYVRESLEEARNSIWNMRSQVLESGDLADALRGILRQMTVGSELQTAFQINGRKRRFAPVMENNLLRIGQEAITNATKHARARQIKVSFDFGEKQFRLGVADDGRGFDPAKPPPSVDSFGLMGMRERAAELKGELQVLSGAGRGTEITVVVPLTGE